MTEVTPTLREVLAQHLADNGFRADLHDKWAVIRVGPIPMCITNVAARRRAVPYHDLNHVVSGYGHDGLGEAVQYDLGPLRERHGSLPVQRLTKGHLDALVADLMAGGTKTAKGRTRRPWSAASVNKAIDVWAMVLADAQQQGLVTRNAAEHIAHVAVRHKDIDTYTESEVRTLLAAIADDRLALGGGAFAYVVSNEAGEPYHPQSALPVLA